MSIDTKAVLADIRSNNRLLDSCTAHCFGKMPDDWRETKGPLIRRKLQCLNCGGKMNLHDIEVYREGYAANGGNPDLVLSGFD